MHDIAGAANGFGPAAGDYERARPSYPPGAVDVAARRARRRPGARVVRPRRRHREAHPAARRRPAPTSSPSSRSPACASELAGVGARRRGPRRHGRGDPAPRRVRRRRDGRPGVPLVPLRRGAGRDRARAAARRRAGDAVQRARRADAVGQRGGTRSSSGTPGRIAYVPGHRLGRRSLAGRPASPTAATRSVECDPADRPPSSSPPGSGRRATSPSSRPTVQQELRRPGRSLVVDGLRRARSTSPTSPHAVVGIEAARCSTWWERHGRRDLPWRRTRDPWAVLVSAS